MMLCFDMHCSYVRPTELQLLVDKQRTEIIERFTTRVCSGRRSEAQNGGLVSRPETSRREQRIRSVGFGIPSNNWRILPMATDAEAEAEAEAESQAAGKTVSARKQF
jgi:hypothetical protein